MLLFAGGDERVSKPVLFVLRQQFRCGWTSKRLWEMLLPMILEIGPRQFILAGLRVRSRGRRRQDYPRFALTDNQNLVSIVSQF